MAAPAAATEAAAAAAAATGPGATVAAVVATAAPTPAQAAAAEAHEGATTGASLLAAPSPELLAGSASPCSAMPRGEATLAAAHDPGPTPEKATKKKSKGRRRRRSQQESAKQEPVKHLPGPEVRSEDEFEPAAEEPARNRGGVAAAGAAHRMATVRRHDPSAGAPERCARSAEAGSASAEAAYCTCNDRRTGGKPRGGGRCRRQCTRCGLLVAVRPRLCCSFYLNMKDGGFDTVAMIIGRQGCNTGGIAHETGAKVRIRGQGSRHVEWLSRREAPTPLMLVVSTEAHNRCGFFDAVRRTLALLRDVEKRWMAHCRRKGLCQRRGYDQRRGIALGPLDERLRGDLAAAFGDELPPVYAGW